MAKTKKRQRKLSLDVYNAQDNESDKLMARRGGGGGAIGRTMDPQEAVEYAADHIDSEDDEEITEDDAFDDSDEERYGLFFTNQPKNKKKSSKNVELDLNEESGSEAEEESNLDGEDYMDLSEMLNEPKKKIVKTDFLIQNEPSDSEIDSGLEELSESETEEEDKDVDLSAILNSKEEGRKRKRVQERTEAFEESQFQVGFKPEQIGRKKLALTDLVNTVAEETNFAGVKSQLEVLASAGTGALSAPLAPRIQERLNRQAAKIQTDKSVSKWTIPVKKNRESKVLELSYREAEPVNLSSSALVGKFEPFTDLEKEINQVLESSGLTEKKQKELEELELKKLSKEEMIERRAELAKMRSLLFYQEQKQKKIAKIKSKTYRKIAKKAAEKDKVELSMEELERLDPLKAKEERDRLEFERAKERMTLKHKNTGKWARKMLIRHGGLDGESQLAVMEQLRKGDELKRRIEGFGSDDSENESEPVLGDFNEKEALEALKEEVEQDQHPKDGIFSMKFMQKEMQMQKNHVLDEIDEMLDGPEKQTVNNNGKLIFAHQPVERRKKKVREVVAQVNIVDGFTATASGPVHVKTPALFSVESFEEPDSKSFTIDINEKSTSFELKPKIEPTSSSLAKVVPNLAKIDHEKVFADSPVSQMDSNPWLSADTGNAVKKSIANSHIAFKKTSKAEKTITKLKNVKEKILSDDSIREEYTLEPAEDMLEGQLGQPALIHSSDHKHLNNQDLMKLAFANDDVAVSFAKEKEEIIERDEGKVIENAMPGWGSWSGPGIENAPRKPKVVTRPDGLDKNKRKDKNQNHVIINEKRIKKATKYMSTGLPHGFENRDQYEKTLAVPLGKEWNAQSSHRTLVKPRVSAKVGAVIKPLRK